MPRNIVIPGTEPNLQGSKLVGAPAHDDSVEITLHLRIHPESTGLPSVTELAAVPLHQRRYLSHAELEQRHGAHPDDLRKVRTFAAEHGLDLVRVERAQRLVTLAGSVAAVSKAFGVYLGHYSHRDDGAYLCHNGPIHVREDVADIVNAVFGLDQRPLARPHHRTRPRTGDGQEPDAYLPNQVAQLYDFPTGLDGSGQSIAIIELGGGYALSDLRAYFRQIGVAAPSITSVSVAGGVNRPEGNVEGSADPEVALDIEVIGAIVPGARLVVYFAPNGAFLQAIKAAIHDPNHDNSIVSISWGGPEDGWSQSQLSAMQEAFQEAALRGITVCAAAGDDGSSDQRADPRRGIYPDGYLHVDFPAASPLVLACGGTRLTADANGIADETVWNGQGATGGGVSQVFAIPDYQTKAGLSPSSANPGGGPGRGVPDVAGNADPDTPYVITVDGQPSGSGGTSAVAPLWSALLAQLNQALGHRVGFINPFLYQLGESAGVFRDITSGDNATASRVKNAYQAGPGWDACTGWGSPIGSKLLAAFQAAKSAGS